MAPEEGFYGARKEDCEGGLRMKSPRGASVLFIAGLVLFPAHSLSAEAQMVLPLVTLRLYRKNV